MHSINGWITPVVFVVTAISIPIFAVTYSRNLMYWLGLPILAMAAVFGICNVL